MQPLYQPLLQDKGGLIAGIFRKAPKDKSSSSARTVSSALLLGFWPYMLRPLPLTRCSALCQADKTDSDSEDAEETEEKSSEQLRVGLVSFCLSLRVFFFDGRHSPILRSRCFLLHFTKYVIPGPTHPPRVFPLQCYWCLFCAACFGCDGFMFWCVDLNVPYYIMLGKEAPSIRIALFIFHRKEEAYSLASLKNRLKQQMKLLHRFVKTSRYNFKSQSASVFSRFSPCVSGQPER